MAMPIVVDSSRERGETTSRKLFLRGPSRASLLKTISGGLGGGGARESEGEKAKVRNRARERYREREKKRVREIGATDVYGPVDETGLNHRGARWISGLPPR